MVALPESNLLFLETRNGNTFQVEFYALDYNSNTFLWKEWKLAESWWISLTSAKKDTLLLQSFVTKGNPDHKNLIACDIFKQTVRWEVNEFSFHDWGEELINGYRTIDDFKPAQVNIVTGHLNEMEWTNHDKTIDSVQRPVQYAEGNIHFNTIRNFVKSRLGEDCVGGVEYFESGNRIIISTYLQESTGLANYLIVLTNEGVILLHEKLGEKLEGLGMDTFFILSGCLFFVKNRLELVVYTL